MKKVITAIALLLALAVPAAASEISIDTIKADSVARNGFFDTLISYRDGGHDTRVLVFMPELDVFTVRAGTNDDSTRQNMHIVVDVPRNTAPGDYVVRYVITGEHDRKVRHRIVTIP